MGKVQLNLQDGSRTSGGSPLQNETDHKAPSDSTDPCLKLHHITLIACFKAEIDDIEPGKFAEDSARENTSVRKFPTADVRSTFDHSYDKAPSSTWLGKFSVLGSDGQSENISGADSSERAATHPNSRSVLDRDDSPGPMDLKSLGARPIKQDVDNWLINYRARCRQLGESLRCPACGGVQRRPSALKVSGRKGF
ncbi:hypothetical protein FS749_014508 [Ceratobasidium sp. UAMH 11750]|nr:hypothetical protein FS749_014508 [Ceratobasidium sp. UAMH 11750]